MCNYEPADKEDTRPSTEQLTRTCIALFELNTALTRELGMTAMPALVLHRDQLKSEAESGVSVNNCFSGGVCIQRRSPW